MILIKLLINANSTILLLSNHFLLTHQCFSAEIYSELNSNQFSSKHFDKTSTSINFWLVLGGRSGGNTSRFYTSC